MWYSDISSGPPTNPSILSTITDIGNNWVEIDSAPAINNPNLIINGDFTLTTGLEKVTDGSFTGISDGTDINQVTGWGNYGVVTSRTIISEELVLVTTTTNTGAKLTITNAVDGQLYHVTADTSGDTGANGVYITNIAGPAVNHSTTNGVDFYFTATTTNPLIYWRAGDNAAGTINIDNVSVKEVLSTTGWDSQFAAFINNEAVISVPSGGDHSYIAQSITTYVPGETYTVTFNAYGSVANNIRVQDNYSDTGGLIAANTDIQLTTNYQTYEFTWVANSSSNNIVISRNNASQVSWDFYIDDVTLKQTSFDLSASLGNPIPSDLYFMFRKPEHNGYSNVSSLKGYYAETALTNDSTSKQELFSVGSEITISSK